MWRRVVPNGNGGVWGPLAVLKRTLEGLMSGKTGDRAEEGPALSVAPESRIPEKRRGRSEASKLCRVGGGGGGAWVSSHKFWRNQATREAHC